MQKCSHFVENHDEPRAVEKFGTDYQANVAALISYTLPGAKFINHGQMQGYRNRLDVHLRRALTEGGSEYTRWFYSHLLTIINMPVFHDNSNWTWLNIENSSDVWRFMAWKVTNGKDKALVVVNYSSGKAYAKVKVPDAEGGSSGMLNLVELMSGQS